MGILSVLFAHLHGATWRIDSHLSALGAVEARGGLERPDEAKSILDVLAPPSCHFRGESYFALGVNGNTCPSFCASHGEGRPGVRDGIFSVESGLKEGACGRAGLSVEDASILGGV